MSVHSSMPPWAVRPLVPEEVYTDRAEHLEYLYDYALKTVTRRAMSTVLLGQRRMGTTEIFKRVVNRLFFEQERYDDIHASVVPVYFSFQVGAAANLEVDVYGAAGTEVWLCESKWRRDRKTGVKDVRILLDKGDWLRNAKGGDLEILRLWFFSHGGFTREAEALMARHGVLRCDRDDLNALLAHVGLKRLPDIFGGDDGGKEKMGR